MDIEISKFDNQAKVTLNGRLDRNNINLFEENCKSLVNAGVNFIVFDFESVGYVSSGGIACLLRLGNKIIPDGGQVIICKPNSIVREIFEIAGLHKFLTITDIAPEELTELIKSRYEELSLPVSTESILSFQSLGLKFAENNEVAPGVFPKIEFIIEEILQNIMNHSYKGSDEHVVIRFFISGKNYFGMEFTDSGPEFNPLEHKEPELYPKLKKRKIGGLGIYLVKQTADRVYYRYENRKNILTVLIKKA